MRVSHIVASLGAAIAVTPVGSGTASAALDNEQFCTAISEIARVGNANAGTWLDRHTRDDGIEVICRIRTVNYKRFFSASLTGQAPDWRDRKQHEWNRTACGSIVLRDAIDAGWMITSSITSASGERILLIATCN
jgi:hypothetical protein